jgi:hypothetical protein
MYGGLVKEKPYTIDRFQVGSYVDGDWVEGTSTPVPIMASIQPVRGYRIIQLQTSTGIKTSNWIKIFTKSELQVAKEGVNGTGGDRITYRNERYELRELEIHDEDHLDHFVGWAARVELAPDEDTL